MLFIHSFIHCFCLSLYRAVIVTVLAGNLIRPIAAAALPVVVLVTPFVRTVLLLARPMDKEGQAPSYTHYRQVSVAQPLA